MAELPEQARSGTQIVYRAVDFIAISVTLGALCVSFWLFSTLRYLRIESGMRAKTDVGRQFRL